MPIRQRSEVAGYRGEGTFTNPVDN